MKTIDFLPESYRERFHLQRARVWWGMVAAVFGSAIGASAVAQWGLACSVKQQLANLQSRASEAGAQDQRFAELQAEVRRGSDQAALCVYLKHPWPRTQVLAALVKPLPHSVKLTELRIRQEAASPAAQPARRPVVEAKPDAGLKPGPAADLAKLREEFDHQEAVVVVVGETTDALALHRYVAALGTSDILTGTRLKSFEASESGQATNVRFELRASLRPAYGLPGGPEAPQEMLPAERPAEMSPDSPEGPLL